MKCFKTMEKELLAGDPALKKEINRLDRRIAAAAFVASISVAAVVIVALAGLLLKFFE